VSSTGQTNNFVSLKHFDRCCDLLERMNMVS
jgi:hypothetical protein